MTALCMFSAGAASEPEASASAFVLYCPDNGSVLLSRAPHAKMKPASTTKLMTSLLTLEAASKGDSLLTFTREMTAEGSSMYLKYGDKLRLSDLAVGMMMCSGNDAANAAALTISGSFEKFAELMNSRAKRLGMADTRFVTPSGLDAEGHCSSAFDLALLMEEGLKNKAFAELTSQKSASVSFEEPEGKRVSYRNHNRLLTLYPDCIGGKTGYTDAAGRCLVSAARRDGVTLICVTLDDRDDWNDHIRLYDYGFSRLERVRTHDSSESFSLPCVGGERESVPLSCGRDLDLVIEKGRSKDIERRVIRDCFLYAPVERGEEVGRIEYLLDGRKLGSVSLEARESVKRRAPRGFFERIKEWWRHGKE